MPKPRRLTVHVDEPSPVCATRALASLGYATLAAEVAGHTDLPFDALPPRVQAGWLTAARAMRQQVLEEERHEEPGDAPTEGGP